MADSPPPPLGHPDHPSYLRDRLRKELGIVYDSLAMATLFEKVARVASGETVVLITGESGTGKELVARAIHHLSPRASHPFIAANMPALAEDMVESELFGHVKGAFTGAITDREGYFMAATRSSLFLDEIAETSPRIQAKLLRVLQEKEVTRVGREQAVRTGARIIAATNRDLVREVQEGRFRADLRFRLTVFRVHVAPLRERPEDIRPLTEHFLRIFSQGIHPAIPVVSEDAWRVLKSYPWPGNVRELKNTIDRVVVMGDPTTGIGESSVRAAIEENGGDLRLLDGTEDDYGVMGVGSAEYVRVRHIVKVLKEEKGNRTRAVGRLDITTQTLRNQVRKGYAKGWVTEEEMKELGFSGSDGDRRRFSGDDDPDSEVRV